MDGTLVSILGIGGTDRSWLVLQYFGTFINVAIYHGLYKVSLRSQQVHAFDDSLLLLVHSSMTNIEFLADVMQHSVHVHAFRCSWHQSKHALRTSNISVSPQETQQHHIGESNGRIANQAMIKFVMVI